MVFLRAAMRADVPTALDDVRDDVDLRMPRQVELRQDMMFEGTESPRKGYLRFRRYPLTAEEQQRVLRQRLAKGCEGSPGEGFVQIDTPHLNADRP